jgi:hypothetical protein
VIPRLTAAIAAVDECGEYPVTVCIEPAASAQRQPLKFHVVSWFDIYFDQQAITAVKVIADGKPPSSLDSENGNFPLLWPCTIGLAIVRVP